MARDQTTLPKAVEDCHELILWLLGHLDRFPRQRRFTLGERLESYLLNVLELLVQAAYTRERGPLLRRANSKLAVARHLWRMAHDLKLVSTRQYEFGARRMDELGRQIGGWLRSQAGDPAA